MSITDLTQDEFNLLMQGLAELPAKLSFNLLTKCLSQVNAKPAEATPSEPAEQ